MTAQVAGENVTLFMPDEKPEIIRRTSSIAF
jgi:hypothetical protein